MLISLFICVLLTQSCLTLRNLKDCIPPGFCPWNSPGKNTGVGCHSLLQEISGPTEWTWVSCIAGRLFTVWATREAPSCFEYQTPGAELGVFETKQCQLCLSLHNLLSHPKTRTLISPPFSKFLMCYCLVVIIPSQLCILQYGIGVLSYPCIFVFKVKLNCIIAK